MITLCCLRHPLMLALLPVELVAEILSELDLPDLIHASQLSTGIRAITADAALNPWRRPVLRALHFGAYNSLRQLSDCSTVPRQNWIEILALAPPPFVLFDASVPRLATADWEQAFTRRFLPAWRRWKRDASWKEAYLKLLYRVWHRALTSCTADESWTKSVFRSFRSPIPRLSVHQGTSPSIVMVPLASSRPPRATLILLPFSMKSSPSLYFLFQNAAHLCQAASQLGTSRNPYPSLCYLIYPICLPAYVELGCS